jgi:hypothetical protein
MARAKGKAAKAIFPQSRRVQFMYTFSLLPYAEVHLNPLSALAAECAYHVLATSEPPLGVQSGLELRWLTPLSRTASCPVSLPALYASDYSLTLDCAWRYRTRAKDKPVIEGSYQP